MSPSAARPEHKSDDAGQVDSSVQPSTTEVKFPLAHKSSHTNEQTIRHRQHRGQRPEEDLHTANGNGPETEPAHLHTDEEPKEITAAGSKHKRTTPANPEPRWDHPSSRELGDDENRKRKKANQPRTPGESCTELTEPEDQKSPTTSTGGGAETTADTTDGEKQEQDNPRRRPKKHHREIQAKGPNL
jgi:hypothetical protein